MAGFGGLFLAAIAIALPVFQETEAARAALAKSREFLEAKPFNGAGFDRLVQSALELGEMREVEREYAGRLEADAADRTARIVLARLRARARRNVDALELLAPLEEESAGLLHLRGRLFVASGELERGAAELDRAAALSGEELERTEILTLAGRTWARLGREDAARASFRALAALDPENFGLRTEISALLAESGFHELAREELDAALELAAGDPERIVRAQVAIGRLEEQRGRSAEAKRAYARAAEHMHAGHWMRRELLERRLALHRAEGTLEELVDLARAEVRESPSNPGARGFLAQTLVALDRREEGLEVFAAAVEDFPASLELGRERAQLLAASGRAEDAVVEYQRLAGLHADAVEPHLEAGTLLAALGREEAALGQWKAALARRPKSVELRTEVARLQQHFGLEAAGEELLREAMQLAPGDLRPVDALIEAWERRGFGARAITLLTQVQLGAARRGDASMLEELAYRWLDQEETSRAVRALEQALEAGGERRHLLLSLAALVAETGPFEREVAVLTELFALAPDARERLALTERITAAYSRAKRLAALRRQAQRDLRADPRDLRARLLLARSADEEEARAVLQALLDEGEHEQDALLHLSAHHESHGRIDEAIAALRGLLQRVPNATFALEEIARLHEENGDAEALAAVRRELLRSDPTNKRLLTELAEKALEEERFSRAIELYRRIVELHPRDDEARLALAEALHDEGRAEEAREEVAPIARARDPERRARARELFTGWMGSTTLPEVEVERLQERMLTEPERAEHGLLAAYLALDLHAYETAQEIADRLLLRFSREPAVAELRQELWGLSLASLSEPFDLEAAGRGAGAAARADLELAELLVAQGEGDRARRILVQADLPVAAANLLLARGEGALARRLLTGLCREDPEDPRSWIRLSVAYLAEGRTGWAARALDDALTAAGSPWALLLAKGRLSGRRGYRRGVREAGQALLAKLSESREQVGRVPDGRRLHRMRVAEVASLHDVHELDFVAAAVPVLEDHPEDATLLDATLTRMGPRDARRAVKLLEHAGDAPAPGWSAEEWELLIAGHRARFPRRRR